MRYWFYILWLSAKWIFRVNLGDHVWYHGKRYVVANGVLPQSWRLAGLENERNGWVPRCACKKSCAPRNLFGSFASGYRFYMQNWYGIWKRGGITPWMRSCDIW